MGFTFDGVHSKNMKITARILSWQVSPAPRNAFEVIPGRMGIADLGSDTSEKYIKVICNIFPQHSFTEVIHLLDDVAEWLNPNLGLKQLVLDDIPNRYFLARLVEEVDCERILRSAGSFELTFICPDPYGYAITDEQFTIESTGIHAIERELGNIESFPIYRLKGNISSSSSTFLTVTTNGETLKINGPLSSNEVLIIDSGLLTSKTSVGGYFEGYYDVTIHFQNKKLTWKYSLDGDLIEKELSDTDITTFLSGLKVVDLLNWKRRYEEPDVLDGTQWEVEIIREKRNLNRSGSNKFPAEWEYFCKLVRTISGSEFE